MSSLADLQRDFQAAVLTGDPAVFASNVDNRALERIAIYQEAYRIRLREALASNYPQLKVLIGAEAFDSIADTFIDAYPSTHPSIRWFGRELGSMLGDTFPARPWLREFAELEWALSCAFDAADAEVVAMSQLAQCPAAQWPTLTFTFHPSVQCLVLHTNAAQMYKAVTEEQPSPSFTSVDLTSWLIWREDLTPHYRSLAADEADALQALLRGSSFEDMCTRLCTHHVFDAVAARAIELLKNWLNARMICGLRCG
jgi:hypothetical protein